MSESIPMFIEIFFLALTLPLAFVIFMGVVMYIRDFRTEEFGKNDYTSLAFAILLCILGMAIAMIPILIIADWLGV